MMFFDKKSGKKWVFFCWYGL